MTKSSQIICIVGAIVSFCACNPKYYVPNTQNVPLFTERGQVSLTAVGNGNQVEFQGAYAVTDRVGIMANTAFYHPKDDGNGNGGSGKLLEAGLGYYKPLTDHLVFETYGLLGFGDFENHFPTANAGNPGKISGKLSRFGLQPAIGYKTEVFSVALSSRLSSLHYGEPDGNLVFDNVDQIAYLKDNNSFLLLEPALTLRAGLRKVKLQVQLTRGFNLTDKDFRQDESLLTLGVNFDLR